jgi:DNA-directed DNA polymerase III PolC
LCLRIESLSMYLNCHTYFSLRYGTFSAKTLLEIAQQEGIQQLVLTDINNTSACLNFIRIAPKYGVQPIVGIDFRNGIDQQYIGIAKNNEGFAALNKHLSEHLHQSLLFRSTAPPLEHTFIIYPYRKALQLHPDYTLKDNEFIGIQAQELRQLPFSNIKHLQHRMVVLQAVSFRDKYDFNIHRLLRSIDNNTLLSKLAISEQGSLNEVMYPKKYLLDYFKDYPAILKNTTQLLAQCSIHFDFSTERKPQNQQSYTGDKKEDTKLIHRLCKQGLTYRYGKNITPQILQRLDKELAIIEQMNFVSYFLINWDIVNYAQEKDYYYVGRGSGANSIIAYLLKITDVDPIELDLYFERFINLYRTSPPDFDIDFSWRDRADVTRYIFSRFKHTALLATYSTFQYRAAIRELGKVFGLPKHEIDQLAMGKRPPKGLDKLQKFVVHYAQGLQGMPNHLSIHAGGILILEKPIHYFTATFFPPKGFATTQFDMVVAEDVGLYKFDILAQRGLAKIKEALSIIKYNHPDAKEVDIHHVTPFKSDPKINNLIKQAKCIGCFYVESPAMRMLLKKLEVDNYLGLVAASSIIRPGVAKSGMMREYILRHRKDEKASVPHQTMQEIMPETYGIMVYQEDVIKVAHLFAGLTLGEADVLRRGMSGKYRSREEFQKAKNIFFNNCKEKGYKEGLTEEVWRQIESFAGYAFAKGHSASYAIESYQTIYLKAYYPLEYMVAILNNGGGFYNSELYIHEARMLGAKMHKPHINISYGETIIKGKDIHLGFTWLRSLEVSTIKKIIESRNSDGDFKRLEDFSNRVPISIEQLSILLRAGAFDFTGKTVRTLLWEAHVILDSSPINYCQPVLFKQQRKKYTLPELTTSSLENAYDEIELLGFTFLNPFELLKENPKKHVPAKDFNNYISKLILVYGYLVARKNTRTSGGNQMMNFGTFLDRNGDFIDTVHFPNSARDYPFKGKGVYAMLGKVVEEFGFYSLEVQKMKKMAYVADPRYAS